MENWIDSVHTILKMFNQFIEKYCGNFLGHKDICASLFVCIHIDFDSHPDLFSFPFDNLQATRQIHWQMQMWALESHRWIHIHILDNQVSIIRIWWKVLKKMSSDDWDPNARERKKNESSWWISRNVHPLDLISFLYHFFCVIMNMLLRRVATLQ